MNNAQRARIQRAVDAEAKRRAKPEIAKADARSRARVQACAARRYLQAQVQEALEAGEPVSAETLVVLCGGGNAIKTKR